MFLFRNSEQKQQKKTAKLEVLKRILCFVWRSAIFLSKYPALLLYTPIFLIRLPVTKPIIQYLIHTYRNPWKKASFPLEMLLTNCNLALTHSFCWKMRYSFWRNSALSLLSFWRTPAFWRELLCFNPWHVPHILKRTPYSFKRSTAASTACIQGSILNQSGWIIMICEPENSSN